MKTKTIFKALLLLFIISSCEMREPDFNSYSIELKIAFSEEVPLDFRDSAKVVLSNLTKSYSRTQYTLSSGEVFFDNIEPGFYSATVVHSYSESGAAYYLNGYKLIDIFSPLSDTIIPIISKTNAFVIKEYYYSGCLTPAGKQYLSDQFVEIYNNSSLLQYADGISLIEHESYSLEDNYWTFLTDTIVARMIWTIPGEGNDVPVPPGTSIILARDGINHQDPILGNPLCPVNLMYADFEFWVESPTGGDVDAPFAANLIENLFTFRGSDIAFHSRGGSAIAIALIPGDAEARKTFIENNLIRKELTSTRYYGKVPNEYILDAVEVTWDEDHAIYKRFPLELDAGYTYIIAGAKSGLCVRRKVQEVVDGRIVYQDTNNSTEDFIKDLIPKPWIYEE